MEILRSDADARSLPARPASAALPAAVPAAPALKPFRHGPFEVRLAADLPDLEDALALERRVSRSASGGVDEPVAVPFCEFLMARDGEGRLAGVCRLLPHGPRALRHGLPGAARDAGMGLVFPGSAPLLTAIRYAGLGVLEAGAMALPPEADREAACRALWSGLARRLAALGYGYALGRERVVPVPGVELRPALLALQDSHGLHPDLEEETGLGRDWAARRDPGSRPRSPQGRRGAAGETLPGPLDWLPLGLREGLRHGCRLAGSPVFHAGRGCLEFVWVASVEMLRADDADSR